MAVRDLATVAQRYGLEVGSPQLKSIGPIGFGPDGILFAADNDAATIYAIALGQDGPEDSSDSGSPAGAAPAVSGIDSQLAALLGCNREDVHIQDMAAAPEGSAVYLSVMRGSGKSAQPILARVSPDGAIEEVELEQVPFAATVIADAPDPGDSREDIRVVPQGEPADEEREYGGVRLRLARQPLRRVVVTDLAYVDGALLVAGASNEEFSSRLRRITFPFTGDAVSSSLEIFHVSHGKYETASPIRTFAPYGEMSILASYTCTPLVRFSIADLQPGAQAKGTTVAELGSMNTPLDVVSYRHANADYVLVSNSRHPLLKFAAADLEGQEALVTPREPVGPERVTLPHEGVTRMANWNGSHVLMLQRTPSGAIDLRAYGNATL